MMEGFNDFSTAFMNGIPNDPTSFRITLDANLGALYEININGGGWQKARGTLAGVAEMIPTDIKF